MRSSSNEDPCVERLTHIKSVNVLKTSPLSSSGSSEWDLPAYVSHPRCLITVQNYEVPVWLENVTYTDERTRCFSSQHVWTMNSTEIS
ncbi:hypothetical protein TNCV_2400501 [Trichonephila clavipes]|nr:hypothetical protein TNCV_2400501 [Trichonephila clavipes]